LLVDTEVTAYFGPIAYNPCVECKLCVAACPTGAISADGYFDFSACQTHNYREFMGGFTDWVEKIADSTSSRHYRRKVSDSESASMWQSLSFGANYKAAYCLGVCPAGEDVIAPFLTDRPGFLHQVLKPLQDKDGTVYVVAGSDAETYHSFPEPPDAPLDAEYGGGKGCEGLVHPSQCKTAAPRTASFLSLFRAWLASESGKIST